MASLTGGAFTTYTGPEALDPIYGIIRSQHGQYEIVYRSAIDQSGTHRIAVGLLREDREVRSDPFEVSVAVQPPAPTIVEPASGTTYNRVADHWDVDPAALEPRQQPVTVDVSWPDGHQRTIQQISYIVDGVVVETLPPDESFTWDFSELSAGDHSLEVAVKDELGLVGRSDPVKTTINIDIPPAPTATPLSVEKVVQSETGPLALFSTLSMGLAGLAMLVALYVFVKRPQVVEDMTTTIVGVAREATEIFVPRREKASDRRAHAFLIPSTSDDSQDEPIPITKQSVLLGRDHARAEITFPDKTVSRLHAKIVEESDGLFKIYDEGSTSGTYVNYNQVPPEGRELRPGDEIELGRIELTFQTRMPGERAETEPFERMRRGTDGPERDTQQRSSTSDRGEETVPIDQERPYGDQSGDDLDKTEPMM